MSVPKDQDHPPKVSKATLDYLTADIKDVYFDNQQKEHVELDKKEILQLFEVYIKGVEFTRRIANFGLEVIGISQFGSSANPLASNFGDLDLCLWVKEKPDAKNLRSDPNLVLRELCDALRANRLGVKNNRDKQPFQIKGAKVPIIKAQIYNYDVDISVHIGDLQHPNTCAARLIQAYDLFNPNFVYLCFYVKEWFKYVVTNEPKGVTAGESVLPNSYTITLLVAQFMQDKGLLPKLLSIHEDNFFLPSDQHTFPDLRGNCAVTDTDIENFKKYHEKELSEELGVTFYRFLEYYTTEIDLKTSALLVESAEFVPISTLKDFPKRHELVILDVFDKYNPGRRVKTVDGFIDFLKDAKKKLENAHNPTRITDRLYDMSIDFKLIERGHRAKVKQAKIEKNDVEVQALNNKMHEMYIDVEAEHTVKKNNRPGNAERRRKQNQQNQAASHVVAIGPEVAPDGQPILPARTSKPIKKGNGPKPDGARPSSSAASGKNTPKRKDSPKDKNGRPSSA